MLFRSKGLVFLVSTHVAFLGFILLSTLAVPSGQVLLPIQILWMELFIDLSTSIAFEREAPEPRLMRRAPRHADRPLLSSGLLVQIAGAGGFTAVGALALLLRELGAGGSFTHAAWLAYTTLVVGQCVRAYANRSLRVPVLGLPPNGFLLLACLAAVGIQAAIPFVPVLAEAFRAAPLSGTDWLLVLLVAILPAALAESVRALGRGRVAWVA